MWYCPNIDGRKLEVNCTSFATLSSKVDYDCWVGIGCFERIYETIHGFQATVNETVLLNCGNSIALGS